MSIETRLEKLEHVEAAKDDSLKIIFSVSHRHGRKPIESVLTFFGNTLNEPRGDTDQEKTE